MTFTAHVDLGQVIIMAMMGTIGFFVKRTIDDFSKRLDKHDSQLFKLVGDVQRLIGRSELKFATNVRTIIDERERERTDR